MEYGHADVVARVVPSGAINVGDYDRHQKELAVLGHKYRHPCLNPFLGTSVEAKSGNFLVLFARCDGGTLAGYYPLEEFDKREYVRIFGEVLSALAFLHRHRVAHRGLHPANVLLHGTGKRAQLTDLGMFEFKEEDRKDSRTAAYLPPEVFAALAARANAAASAHAEAKARDLDNFERDAGRNSDVFETVDLESGVTTGKLLGSAFSRGDGGGDVSAMTEEEAAAEAAELQALMTSGRGLSPGESSRVKELMQRQTAHSKAGGALGAAPPLASDVYAFGLMLWECWFKQPPFKGQTPEAIAKTVLDCIRPPRKPGVGVVPTHYTAPVKQLDRFMKDCWAQEKIARPSCGEAESTWVNVAAPAILSTEGDIGRSAAAKAEKVAAAAEAAASEGGRDRNILAPGKKRHGKKRYSLMAGFGANPNGGDGDGEEYT